MSNTINESQFEGMDAIDAAIAKAKARAKARLSSEESAIVESSNGEKTSRQARAEIRASQKVAREQARNEKKLLKELAKSSADSKPVHMKKVERAAGRLPQMGSVASGLFEEATRSLNAEQRAALALHIQHHNRVQSTLQATSSSPLKIGQVVKIMGGDPKFIGSIGAVEKVQRIRCYVSVPGSRRPVYCFVSEVDRLEEDSTSGVPESTTDNDLLFAEG